MYSGLYKLILSSRKIWLYALLPGMIAVMVPSCGGSKQSASMRDIEKHAKKHPVDENGLPTATRKSGSKKVRQALAQQEKQKAAADKEAEKAYKDAITRHRSLQTQETLDRMDQRLKEANKRNRHKKEFFAARWFQPKDDIEKIEKRQARDVQKRMAASRKQAEKNNKELVRSSTTNTKERKQPLPKPGDTPHGGGGVYKEGSATRFASPSGVQHGGGGSYAEGRSGSRVNASNAQHGGGGTYQTRGSENRKKASDYQQGGGGNMSGKTKKTKLK